MADSSDAEPLSRQIRQHLASLKAAGVEWAPASATVPIKPAEPAPSAGPSSLFAEESLPRNTLDLDQRRQELTVLAQRVAGCMRCTELASTRTQTVFGVGSLLPDLCFVGEAPGAEEDARGEPFVGAAGQLLNRIISACGMKREDVYICNILRCRPPGNRTPLPDEAAHCREYLEQQLELVAPKFICCLGACASQNLLNTTQSISRMRGRFHDYRGIPVLCTFHPSYLLHNPAAKKDVWEDMKRLLSRMGKPIPAH
ncbi:MAG: uracil-DNA glycosylase [Gemmataceae bacterium]|nr:uracil-DNA glycosylase [Gemmataceae bacterium]